MPTYAQLLAVPKTMASTVKPRVASKPGHRGIDVAIMSDMPGTFGAFIRVSARLVEHFSCGLVYEAEGLPVVTVLRVNGDHGGHTNPDGAKVSGAHIHWPNDMQALPAAGDQPQHGEAIDAANNVLPFAWSRFCSVINLVPHQNVARAVSRLHTALAQGSLDDFFTNI